MGYQVLRAFARNNPELAWVTWPLIGAYLAFVWMTWLAAPLMNLALRLHPVGRHALSRDQRLTANLVGGLLLAALVVCAAALATGIGPLLPLAFFLALSTMPASLIFVADAGWPRLALALMTLALIGLACAIVLSDLRVLPAAVGARVGPIMLPLVLISVFGGQFVAAQRVKR